MVAGQEPPEVVRDGSRGRHSGGDLAHAALYLASRLVMEGVNLKTVQELMGRKTISMNAYYAYLAPSYLESELETLVKRRGREE